MAQLARFRCCFLDATGAIALTEAIECADGLEAISIAQKIWTHRPHYHGIELWQGFRRVHLEVRARDFPASRLRPATLRAAKTA